MWVVLLLCLLLPGLPALQLDCAPTAAGPPRQLRCFCRGGASTRGREPLSALLNPELSARSSLVRPVSERVGQVVVAGCGTLDLLLDLDQLDSRATDLTDLSFQDMASVVVAWAGRARPRLRLVFTDIPVVTVTGSLRHPAARIEMFFRQLGPAGRDSSRVTFRDTHMQADIRLLNFLNVAHLAVSGSSFNSVAAVDIHSKDLAKQTECHSGPGKVGISDYLRFCSLLSKKVKSDRR